MLRSMNDQEGYAIRASDGTIGLKEDNHFDDAAWVIRYLIVDTGNGWLGHQVLIAPHWIEGVRWSEATVSVNRTRQAVQDAPPYDSAAGLEREEALGIHEHPGRPGYWTDEAKRKEPLPTRITMP